MWELIKGLFTSGKILESAKDIIDEVVTSKEEKAKLHIMFEQMLNEHEQTILKMEVKDRDSARNREIETAKVGSRNFTQNILAYVGVIGFFAMMGYLLSNGLGEMNAEESFIIGNLTGMAGAIAKDIFSYYFGSSKGEHDTRPQAFDWQRFKNSDEFRKIKELGKDKGK